MLHLKQGANHTLEIVFLAVIAVAGAVLLAAWLGGVFDDATEQLESNLQRERGSMVASGGCEDGVVAAVVQNRWRRPANSNVNVTGGTSTGKRMQISAELNERTWGMDFNADGDTNDLIPRLPDALADHDNDKDTPPVYAAATDREWLETPGGIVIGSKDFGNTDFAARISELSVPLFSYKDLLQSSAAASDLQKFRDASKDNAYINFYWNVRTSEQLDRLAPSDSDPQQNRRPPSLPAVAVPSIAGGLQSSHNPRTESMMFNAQIIVDKQAGCWAVKYDREPEIQCADGTDACFTGHSWEYLTSVFTGDVSIVFRYPTPELNIRINNPPNFTPQPVDLAGRATEAGETVTCGAISAALSTNITVSKVAGQPCRYAILPTSAAKGRNTVQIHFTSTSGAERTIDLPVHVSNIQFTAPTTAITAGRTATIALTPTDGKFDVTCGDATGLPAGVTSVRTGCSFSLTAAASTATGSYIFTSALTSPGGDSKTATVPFQVREPSNIVFTAPPVQTLRSDQTLTLDASTHAIDGSYTISCTAIAHSTLIAASALDGCNVTITPDSTSGAATFTVTFESSGGDTATGTFNVTIQRIRIVRSDFRVSNGGSGISPAAPAFGAISYFDCRVSPCTVPSANCASDFSAALPDPIPPAGTAFRLAVQFKVTDDCSGLRLVPRFDLTRVDGTTALVSAAINIT